MARRLPIENPSKLENAEAIANRTRLLRAGLRKRSGEIRISAYSNGRRSHGYDEDYLNENEARNATTQMSKTFASPRL